MLKKSTSQAPTLRRNFPRTRRALAGFSEVIVFESRQSKTRRLLRSGVQSLLTLIVVISLLTGLVLVVPSLYYRLFPADVAPIQAAEKASVLAGEFTTEQTEQNKETFSYVPPKDTSLPEGEWISIPRIGVKTQLRKTPTPEEALAHGVWWVPDFGEPGDTEIPMIVAAH